MSQPAFKAPSNVILKSVYDITAPTLKPNYIGDAINEILDYIKTQNPTYYPSLEIEAKLGVFKFIGNAVKSYNYINETFRIPNFDTKLKDYKYEFEAGVQPKDFFLIWDAVEREAAIPKSDIIPGEVLTYKEKMYRSGKRQSMIYKDGKFIREEVIRKEDKKHINFKHFHKDFRITCSKEMATDIGEGDDVVMERNKFRCSYRFRFFRLDFTIANSSKTGGSIRTYEIEVEFDKIHELLAQANGNVYNSDIPVILERFIQNILNIYTPVSATYCSRITEKKESIFQNQFGNYLEYNYNPNK